MFAVSAWNDNGFRDLVQDKAALRRTTFFPGLGWMLARRLYESEVRTASCRWPRPSPHPPPQLEPHWPETHWDHWLRSIKQHNGRETVYPEVRSHTT